jgi:site-specific recombinase XerC
MSRAPRGPKTLSLTELVDRYLLRCRAEGKSDQTVRAYAESLRRFLRALDEDGVLSTAEDVQEEHVYAFLARSAHLSASSRNRYFRETRTFFSWLVSTGRLGESPFRHMKNVRLPEKVVQPYAAHEVLRLVAECPASPIGARDRAVLFLLLDTGLRVSELAQLDLDDVDIGALRVRVLHGKAGKQRVVPFSEACRNELLAYLSVRGPDTRAAVLRVYRPGSSPARDAAAGRRREAAVAPPRTQDRPDESARTPVPAHVRDVGHPAGRAGARRSAPARAFIAAHGAPLLRQLQRRAGRAPAPGVLTHALDPDRRSALFPEVSLK